MDKPEPAPNHNAVDVAKLALVLLILCAHFASTKGHFPALIDTGFSLYVVAVPFFFACSGFLLFGKLRRLGGRAGREAFWKYVVHIARLYLAWSAVYLAFVAADWMRNGATAEIMRAYFHKALVFSTYATIWYLPALLIGVLAVFGLSRRFSYQTILWVGAAFYVVGSLGYTYAFLLRWVPALETGYLLHDRWFVTTRNGVFFGFPFVALGAWMADRSRRLPLAQSGRWAGIFLAALAAEAFAIKLHFPVRGVDTVFFLMPFTYFFLEFLLALQLPDRKTYRQMRDMSTLIFLGQRIYITALPAVLPAAWSAAAFRNPYLGLALVAGLTALQSWALIRLSEIFAPLKVFR